MLFSNCCSLEILKLECPRLTSLFLQVCAILTFNEFLDLVIVWAYPYHNSRVKGQKEHFSTKLDNVGLTLRK
jgi:hypothetical protein